MVVCTLYRLIGAFASLPLCRTGSRSVRTRIRLASALGANCGPLDRIGESTNANVRLSQAKLEFFNNPLSFLQN
jgi:hypothetical protein